MAYQARSPYRLTLALAMALTGGVGVSVPTIAQAADPAVNRDSLAIEEIVVTARKREENLQDTPIAITAVNGAELEARGASDLSAIESLAPNVHFSASQPTSGLSGATTVFIRGIGQRDFTINIDPAVGVYFDGVYVGRSIGALMDLVDIERVEVLRGPQNTLFGRNTIGGAISVLTKAPSRTFGGWVKAAGGDDSRAEVAGSVNIPISDAVRASVTAFYRHQDGYVKALQYNDVKLGEDDIKGARAKVVFDFSEKVSLEIAGDLARSSNTPGPVVPVVLNTLLPVGTVGTGPFNTFFNNSLTLSGDDSGTGIQRQVLWAGVAACVTFCLERRLHEQGGSKSGAREQTQYQRDQRHARGRDADRAIQIHLSLSRLRRRHIQRPRLHAIHAVR